MTDHNYKRPPSLESSRRTALKQCAAGLVAVGAMNTVTSSPAPAVAMLEPRPWLKIRGVYGGFPHAILERGQTPADYGLNAIWVGSGALKRDEVDRYHQLGLKVFAEFNSMHFAAYVEQHPDAAPIGTDGRPSPPPHGWQGVSP